MESKIHVFLFRAVTINRQGTKSATLTRFTTFKNKKTSFFFFICIMITAHQAIERHIFPVTQDDLCCTRSIYELWIMNLKRPRHTMGHVAKGCCNKSPRACGMWKSLSLRQNFVAAICRTNSNWFAPMVEGVTYFEDQYTRDQNLCSWVVGSLDSLCWWFRLWFRFWLMNNFESRYAINCFLLNHVTWSIFPASRSRGAFAMNDLPVTRYPCYAQRTLGSPGGKHCKSLKRKCITKSCFDVQKSDFWERSGFGQCWYMENVSFHLNNR